MKINNYPSFNVRTSLCAIVLFISISSTFAKSAVGDKPIKEKSIQKTELSKGNSETNAPIHSDNAKAACQPKNCVPIVITKSKTS